ncbi:MAG: hypothetical protein CL779_00895 [Chloroflexi bacterium]|nr:hypothetical protein [Chloroflexota bacterium]|tara:strand:+ start:4038 stop:4736 length:699 start_codon:yes stop_codon:yes gene_type:complete
MKKQWQVINPASSNKLSELLNINIDGDFSFEILIGPSNSIGANYFSIFLKKENTVSLEPIILGLFNSGIYPGYNWLEIINFKKQIAFDKNQLLEVSEQAELEIFANLGKILPPGGHLMIEYESAYRRLTARSLLVGVPPDATPVGRLLYIAGCGYSIKNWYIPEGGREGLRKLQGFKPLDRQHQIITAKKQINILNQYINSDQDLEWDITGYTKPIAEQAHLYLSDIIKNEK